LIKHTKNISAQSRFGWTPLHIAALWSSDVLLAQLLIQAGADLEVPLGQPGAEEADRKKGTSKMFPELNDLLVTSLTPLGLAVAKSNHDMARYLLRMGAKPQMLGPSGIGVLFIAAAMGNTAMLVLLCKQGVGFRKKDCKVSRQLSGLPQNNLSIHGLLPDKLSGSRNENSWRYAPLPKSVLQLRSVCQRA
jgi:ankyrin repeat protein